MSDELTVSNPCYQCMIQMELCVDCQDIRETRATIVAHDLVDESSDIYRYAPMYTSLMKIEPEPSGHDWTEREGEYKLPIVMLQDGGTYEELWELDDMRQRSRETECRWCHLLTPKVFNDCQACDKPLELNVR